MMIRLGKIAFCLVLCQPAYARWATIESAPIIIQKHDISTTVDVDGSWKQSAVIEIKIQNEQGRSLLKTYRMPFGDEFSEMKIDSAEIIAQPKPNAVPKVDPKTGVAGEPPPNKQISDSSIVLQERPANTTSVPATGGFADSSPPPLFQSTKAYLIPFGELPIGTTVRIAYNITTPKVRIPKLFSMVFDWGREYPQMAGTLIFESKSGLYFDISAAGRKMLTLAEGRLPEGQMRWQLELKAPIYRKVEGEIGGILSTTDVPRVQVANQKSWASVVEFLKPRFALDDKQPMPDMFKAIVTDASAQPTVDAKLNRMIQGLNQALTLLRDWKMTDDGLTPQSLKGMSNAKRGDVKEFAYASIAMARAMGFKADVAFIWKQPQGERLWIDERVTTPSLALFNHIVIRINEAAKDAPPKYRYFDPTNAIAFADGFLSEIGGSWALAIADGADVFEKLPNETPMPSKMKISQKIEIRPDANLVASGHATVEGPLAAELKQLFFARGAADSEPYLRTLFGLGGKSDATSPTIRVEAKDKLGRVFEVSFSYLAPNAVGTAGSYRFFDLVMPGLSGVPLLANPDRVTDVILSRQLAVEVETEIRGAALADETNTSCLVLSPFASVLRETRINQDSFVISDHLAFRRDRITVASMQTKAFKDELQAYTNCLLRRRVSVGPRPAFEKTQLGLTEPDVAVLKKPVAMINLQDVKGLEEISSSQLKTLVQTKIWLSTRDMLRRNLRSPQVMLDYASALLQLGALEDGTYLVEHISEAATIFRDVSQPLAKVAKLHRLHAQLLFAIGRNNEALVALKNAMALEADNAADAMMTGQVYSKIGDMANAEAWLRRATTLKGTTAAKTAALESYAKLRLQQGKMAEFVSLYERAIRESLPDPWLHYRFAVLLNSKSQWDASLEQSRKALTMLKFAEAEKLLASTLMRKATSLYIMANGMPTEDPSKLNVVEQLALECLKYSKTEGMAYRIAGHAAFVKALAGDYGSLIATQSYFSKAIELGIRDDFVVERFNVSNQALGGGGSLGTLWQNHQATKRRVPAAK